MAGLSGKQRRLVGRTVCAAFRCVAMDCWVINRNLMNGTRRRWISGEAAVGATDLQGK